MVVNNDTVSTANYTVASFFGGVGGIDLGFEQTKKFSTVFINEFDKNAQETIAINFPEVHLDRRDIHEVQATDVPSTDVIVGGFPCQAFSIAGYRKGFEDDRGDLFFEMLRIVAHHKPKAILIENVKNMVTHDHGNTFKVIREALTLNGYCIKWKVMNGKDYGNIPQNRERIYIVGFRDENAFDNFEFPCEIELTNGLDTIIEYRVKMEDKYYYKEGVQPFYDKLKEDIKSQNSVYQWRRQYVRENKSGVVPTLTANMGTGGHNVPLVLTDYGIRKLTPRETFNAQGFPKDFKMPEISNGQLYKQAGNSVVVPVIKRIAEQIGCALDRIQTNESTEIECSSKNTLIYVNMKNRFEGESFVEASFEELDEVNQYIADKDIELLSDESYFKLVTKDTSKKFYSLQVK
ncbi:MAG: DNA cytosine methyltransferase [Cellulosilyticaceae bacterium]